MIQKNVSTVWVENGGLKNALRNVLSVLSCLEVLGDENMRCFIDESYKKQERKMNELYY